MTRRQKAPLGVLRANERNQLEPISRANSAPVVQVERARVLLAVAEGKSYAEAATAVGRKSGDAVSYLVERFNIEGLAALILRHGGGIGQASRERPI